MYRPDPEIIHACLRGDQRAWNLLVDRYSRLVYSVPRRFGLNESDAGEVAQNVFLTLFRKLDTLGDHLLLARWLLTTAHRETWRIGKARRKYSELDAIMPDVSSPSDEQLEQWERQQIVREALDRLGGRCKTLLAALFRGPGKPDYEAVARELDMPVGSIGPTRARCFAKLEPILRELGLNAPGEEAEESNAEAVSEQMTKN